MNSIFGTDHEIEANLDHVARASGESVLLVLFPRIVRILSRSLCCSLARQRTTVLISVLFDDQWRDRVDVCLLPSTDGARLPRPRSCSTEARFGRSLIVLWAV